MPTQQHDQFTVISFAKHMRAGDTKARPIQLLIEDEVFDNVAAIYLTPERARAMAAALLTAADEADDTSNNRRA